MTVLNRIFWTALTAFGFIQAQNAQAPTLSVLPERPHIERTEHDQRLNFDFNIHNPGPAAQIYKIELWVRDAQGDLQFRKYIDQSGLASGIDTVAWKNLPTEATKHLFNPFHHFAPELELSELSYQFTFRRGNTLSRANIEVIPSDHEIQTLHQLPLDGRVLVSDGHDFLSHHRRIAMDHPVAKMIGIQSNTGRYANDLRIVDAKGRAYRNRGTSIEDYYGWNAPVYATADGTVVAIENDFSDNSISAQGTTQRHPNVNPQNPDSMAGNYVAIDHGHGECSILGHLRQGSITVKLGERVKARQSIARLGLSGATTVVHLHHQMQDGTDLWDGEGMPSYFTDFRRLLGKRSIPVLQGTIDSGDLVERITENSKKD